MAHVGRPQRQVEKAHLEIAVDRVLLYAVYDDLAAFESHAVRHISRCEPEALANFPDIDKAVDELPAVAAGRSPANAIRLEYRHVVAALRQIQRGGDSGEAGSHDDDITTMSSEQRRIIRGVVARGRIVRRRMFVRVSH